MRPRLFAAENRLSRGQDERTQHRFNEAAALRRGKLTEGVRGEGGFLMLQ